MDYATLIQTLGLPVAMLVIAIVASRARWWVWIDELQGCEARMEQLRADYEKRLEAQRAAHAARETELAAATERWQRLFFEILGPISSLADVIARSNGGKPP